MLYRLGITYNILDENMEHDDVFANSDIFIESDHPPTYEDTINICEKNNEVFHLDVLNAIDKTTFPCLQNLFSISRSINVHIKPHFDEYNYIVRVIYCELISDIYKI